MTGLEKIIDHIYQESVKESDEILAKAQAEADSIIAAGKAECDKIKAELDDKLKANADIITNRGNSTAALTQKKLMLKAKQDIIDDTLEKAKKHLTELPDTEYFAYLEKLLKKYALPQTGELLLSEKDLKRVPASFTAAAAKYNLTLSKETRKISGGFVLFYQDIEENCSFDAIIDAEKENLQDKIKELLFD